MALSWPQANPVCRCHRALFTEVTTIQPNAGWQQWRHIRRHVEIYRRDRFGQLYLADRHRIGKLPQVARDGNWQRFSIWVDDEPSRRCVRYAARQAWLERRTVVLPPDK